MDGVGDVCYTAGVMFRKILVALVVLSAVACRSPAPPLVEPTVSGASPAPTLVASATPSLAPSASATLIAPTATATETPSPSPKPPTPTATATPAPTATPRPTTTPWPSATPRPSATPTATPGPDDLWIEYSDLRIHPDGDLYYSGDLISFEVSAHHGHNWDASAVPDVDVEVWLGAPSEGTLVAQDRLAFYGGQDAEARMEWAWDTTGLTGPQVVSVLLDPGDEIQIGDENLENNVITRTIGLQPREDLPASWAEAHWVQASSECCVFHYISGTASERDIDGLMEIADEATKYAGARLGEAVDQFTLDVYLIDRILGHGGFADGALIISYLDRLYAGGDMALVFRHEATHVLDRRFAEVRTTLLAEGLAVHVSGGHFRENTLDERAAALLALDRYIPLGELADDFYPSQHEIGYLEAAGFVGYLVDRFGWEPFKAFYSDVLPNDEGQAAMLDAALQDHFGLTLLQLESDWLAVLESLPVPTVQLENLRLTIDFYDTLRRYQREWDPSAYFLEVWLPPLEEAERLSVTADMMRHPSALVNVTLETMLHATETWIHKGGYQQAEMLMSAINTALDSAGDLTVDPITAQYAAIVQATAAAGYEAQQIELSLDNNMANVLATPDHGADIVEFTLGLVAGSWRINAWGN